MSGVDFFDDGAPINPLMTQQAAIDLTEAAAEHGRIRTALESAGVTVHKVAPPADCQDGVFTANWALVRGDKAVMARLPNARKGEEPYAAEVLKNYGKEIIWLPEHIEKFSGQGDALPCGNYLFCGSGYRSDPEAQVFAAEALGFERIQLRAVPLLDNNAQPVINSYSGLPDSFYYDLDLALSILKFPTDDQKGLIAWCPAAFTTESQALLRSFDGVDKIEVEEHEAVSALVCNLVSTGEVVVMNDGAPNFTAAIESHGLKTICLKNPELAKGGGSMRCTSLSFND
jgi:N-dimethylarginine dimethylaminohydrolase